MKAAVAIVGVLLIVLLSFQRHTMSQMRAENGMLSQNQAEAEALKRGAAQIATDAPVGVEIARLKGETHDLLKLRNEVRQLREQKQMIERLRAENEALRALGKSGASQMVALPSLPGLLSSDSLTNAGLSTPEAAVQTCFWALREKDERVRATCFTAHLTQQLQERKGAESLSFQSVEDINTRAIAFRIIGQQSEGADVMIVHLRLWIGGRGAGTDPVTQSSIRLRKIAEEWKVDGY